MKTELKALSAAMLLALGSNAYAADIDLFSTSQTAIQVFTAGSSLSSTQDTAGTDIVGGERDLYIEMISDSGDPLTDRSSISVATSQLRFSNTTGVVGAGQVQWDGNDNNGAKGVAGGALGGISVDGLGGYDLTQSGTVNAFLLETIESDLGYQFAVTLFEYDGDGNAANNDWVRILFNATAVAAGSGPVFSSISFAGFAQPSPFCPGPVLNPVDGVASIECNVGGNGIDMTKVGAIVVDLNTGANPTTAIDLRLGSVTTIPEPSMIGLMGIGLLAAGCANRGRGRKATCAA